MAWVNIFDAGPCRVEVWEPSPDGWQLVPEHAYWMVGIDSLEVVDGVVHVEGADPAQISGKRYLVVPEFSVSEHAVQVAGVAIGDLTAPYESYNVQPPEAMSFIDGSNNLKYVLLEGDGGVPNGRFTPDPAEVTAGGWQAAGLHFSPAGWG